MSGLFAHAVSKRFGGLLALDQVDLELRPGEVHGLIGPNGSGKTTLLNMLCGYYPIDAGRIDLDGTPLSRSSVQQRALAGLARTFQKPRLLPGLSVLENAMAGGWRHNHSGLLASALALPHIRRAERSTRDHTMELLQGVGLADIALRRADLLEHAEQRLLEIARALAATPRYVLLDEPAGGLTEEEIDRLADIVRTMRDCGLGVLLVEHHTDFVFRVSDRVTALDLGRVLRAGTPDEVRTDADVVRVYLGA